MSFLKIQKQLKKGQDARQIVVECYDCKGKDAGQDNADFQHYL